MNDSKTWLDMKDMDFIEIVNGSNIPFEEWKSFQNVISSDHGGNILKPVNRYVDYFGIKPDFKKIEDGHYSIKYKTYSEIFLRIKKNNKLYAVEKSWLRQFYPSSNTYNIDNVGLLSDSIYRFYIPWFIDYDMKYDVVPATDSGSFKIFKTSGFFYSTNRSCRIKNTGFVDFCFTNSKNHMIKDDLGLIKRGTPMYEIHIYPNKDISDRIDNELK